MNSAEFLYLLLLSANWKIVATRLFLFYVHRDFAHTLITSGSSRNISGIKYRELRRTVGNCEE